MAKQSISLVPLLSYCGHVRSIRVASCGDLSSQVSCILLVDADHTIITGTPKF